MSVLLDHYKRGCDPYHLGHSNVDVLAMGYAMTEGTVFPYPGGGVVLRRRRLYPDVGPWSICGFAKPNETTVANMPGFPKQASMGFQYDAAIVLGNGFAGRFSEPVRVDFDSGGIRISPPLPMFPRHVCSEPIAGGRFRVCWEYDPYGQGEWPTDFRAFRGADAASIDFNTPLTDSVTGLTTTPFVGSRRLYEFTTAAYGNGTTHVFAVRARSSAAVSELNTYATQPKTARASAIAVTAVEAVGQRRS